VPDLSAFAVTEGAGEVTQGLIPVRDPGREKPEEGIALCLSRGRLPRGAVRPRRDHPPERDGHLKEIARVSSVSGGSITTDVLGLAWKHLDFGIGGIASNLDELVVKPVRKLAGRRTASGMFASYYAEYLFGGRTVQDLSDDSKGKGPRFAFNATNEQTGKLFRFSRPYEGDYSVGLLRNPSTRWWRKLWLTDGGVYDNLGLETAWKRYRTLLVSDAGAPLQVRTGSYWGIRSDVANYELGDPFPFPRERIEPAHGVPNALVPRPLRLPATEG
jgi:NTE family protein